MGKLREALENDLRFKEGLKACMNCGVCTAICPAAEFYNYDPRKVVIAVQSDDEQELENMLRSETIWYCGECMSCKTRCPRGNTPGFIIMALRTLSQQTGLFTESEKGRQQLAIKRTVGENIFKYGYCAATYAVNADMHPEQGPIWKFILDNTDDVFERLGGQLNGSTGPLRKVPPEALSELKSIFDVTGGTGFFETIEEHSKKKAAEMGYQFGPGIDNDYFVEIYTANSGKHTHEE
jgi:heterodisulfide reductase subunit C1